MALVLADRVLETTSVAGTGDAALNGAQANYQPFSVIGNGNTTYYTIVDNTNNEWEVGIGTYTLSSNSISRDTVLSSSNGGALVYFPSGDKDIFLDLPAEEVITSAGDVTGPASAVANNFAAFNLTTGKLIKDSGYNASTFATAAQGAKADTAVQPGSLGSAAYLTAGAANGVATLDGGGTVPTSQLPAAVLGAVKYQGTWNATTNVPTLASGVGTQGYYYVVATAGSTNLDGITSWAVGDWAIYNGTAWQKIDNTDAVTSVNSLTGTVVLTASDVGAAPATSGTSILYGNGTGGTSNVTVGTGLTFAGGTLASTAAGGDVVGPASSTDNAIARFDLTTGKLLQNSVVTVSDTGAIAGATTITDLDYLDFDTTYATTLGAGQLGWNGNDTLGLGMIGGNVVQHIGEDTFFYVKASATITKGQLCMFTGTVGSSGVLTAAPSTAIPYAEAIIGVAAEDIANNAFGLIQNLGTLRGVDTSAFLDGDILYYNSAVTGGFTKTFPTSGPIVVAAAVAKSGSGGSGVLTVRISFQTRVTASTGISVTQANDVVTVTNTAPDQTVALTAGTGISTSGTYPNFTITNSAPDQTVAITGAGGAVVTGTYPNFTITTPSGTVTSVSGTAPIASSGGATPAISISQATTSTDGYLSSTDWNTFNSKQPSGSYLTAVTASAPLSGSGTVGSPLVISQATTSTNGYLSSTDWNTFNNKGSGTVTSVTGTAPVVSSGGATPAISMAAATTSVNGYLTSTDWNTFNGKYSTGGALGTPSSGTLTNCTGYTYANLSGTVPTWNQDTTGKSAKTDALNSATTTINVSSATAPSAGQALIATSSTAATWQTIAASQWTTSGSNIYYNSGQVSIGNTSPVSAGWLTLNYDGQNYNGLMVRTTTSGTYFGAMFKNSSDSFVGNISVSASATAYNTSSDYRLKDNVASMQGALEKVLLLKPVTYTWKIDGSDGEGFIAHELAEVCPLAVTGEKDALNEDGSIKSQSIDTSFLVATLTAAIQELDAKVKVLESKLAAK
jgi:hypothetical protein